MGNYIRADTSGWNRFKSEPQHTGITQNAKLVMNTISLAICRSAQRDRNAYLAAQKYQENHGLKQ